MHTIDAFQWYNLLVGSLSMVGFTYLLVRNRSIGSYYRFVQVLFLGLLVFAIGGPLADLVAPAWSHAIHTLAALLVIYGLYNPIRNDLRREAWANLILEDPSQVRQPAEWMAPMDDDILELFHSSRLVLTPSIIAYNTGYSREEVNRRLGELTENGLMERVERGKYRITTIGENYLTGTYPVEGETHGRKQVSH
ncbi:hypothetical protein [Natronomonas amylolytica]|uniref:hypothetical protein n=1 Tax=Natronomonas amylolytica TaxID=3108498 RepID=UPI0030087F1D